MNYLSIYRTSLVDGIGWRTVLFVSGCSHHCKGCHNPESWDENAGYLFTEKTKEYIFNQMNDQLDGITISGGDPLYKNNIEEVTKLCKDFKQTFPKKTIWLYTGSLYEDVKDLEIINYIDVLVDGKFELSNRDTTLMFKGSTNQRIINVKTGKQIYKN